LEKDINTMGENPIQSEAEAWLGILYTCIKADHYISEAERKSLTRILYSKEKFKSVDFGPYYETMMRCARSPLEPLLPQRIMSIIMKYYKHY
jgi:hypothetical protein